MTQTDKTKETATYTDSRGNPIAAIAVWQGDTIGVEYQLAIDGRVYQGRVLAGEIGQLQTVAIYGNDLAGRLIATVDVQWSPAVADTLARYVKPANYAAWQAKAQWLPVAVVNGAMVIATKDRG